jgi:hypothetical protein
MSLVDELKGVRNDERRHIDTFRELKAVLELHIR